MDDFFLSHEQLRALVMRLHRVPSSKRVALTGRLKHLQRMGWPPRSNVGKGARVKYGADQVLLLAVTFELIQIGLTPERAVQVVKGSQEAVWKSADLSTRGTDGTQPPAVVMTLGLTALSAALGFDGAALGDTAAENILAEAAGAGELVEQWTRSSLRSLSLLNMTALVNAIDHDIVSLGFALKGKFQAAVQLLVARRQQGETPDAVKPKSVTRSTRKKRSGKRG